MALGPRRDKRIASLVQHEVGGWLLYQKEPDWLPSICITQVNVSKDLQFADVYFCSYLNRSSTDMIQWFAQNLIPIRTHIGQKTSLRKLPILRFKYDDSAEVFAEIERLLDRVE